MFPLLALLAALLFLGCRSTLEPGGAYAPGSFIISTNSTGQVSTNFVATAAADRAFLQADLAYDLAYSVVDAAFKFERDNQARLWALSPRIKQTLDRLRDQAWDIHVRWAVARQAYLANPTPAGLTQVQTLLGQLQNVGAAVQAGIGK